MFTDREDAGKQLARVVRDRLGDRAGIVVLGLPRGGVVVAREVARALNRPLEVVIVRKIGLPGFEELAIGAVGEDGVPIVNWPAAEQYGIATEYLTEAIEEARREIQRRVLAYRGRPRLDLRGMTAVLVDDGIATGYTIEAAIETVRAWGAAQVIVAVPVAPSEVVARLRRQRVDDLIVLHAPREFSAVGQFYLDFPQVSDDAVTAALRAPSAAVS
jgi:putative phosphoribosyl transferase